MVTVIALGIDKPDRIKAGKAAIGSDDSEPYLSLAVFDELDTVALGGAVGQFKSSKIAIGVSGLGIFPNEKPVIYASVLASNALLALHRALYECLGELGEQARPNYHPGNWMPHITMHVSDDLASIPQDISVLLNHPVRGRYNCSEILVVSGPPPSIDERFALQ